VDAPGSPSASSPQVHIYADESNAQQSMSMWASGTGTANYGGTLHGTWVSTSTLTSSDRRMKYDVLPLFKTIMRQHKALAGSQDNSEKLSLSLVPASLKLNSNGKTTATELEAEDPMAAENAVMAAVIRQIRPVSFKYKATSDSKYNRYGFIAQELEAVLPSVIFTDPNSGMKAVNYNDMVAVLALSMQSIDSRMTSVAKKVDTISEKQDTYYLDLSDRMRVMESMMTKVLREGDVTTSYGSESDSEAGNNSTQHQHSAFGRNANATEQAVVETQQQQQQVQKPKSKQVTEQILSLLKRIDFAGDKWASWTPERKEKLRVKLAAYGIDLNEVVAKAQADKQQAQALELEAQQAAGVKVNATAEAEAFNATAAAETAANERKVDADQFDRAQDLENREQLEVARANKRALRGDAEEATLFA